MKDFVHPKFVIGDLASGKCVYFRHAYKRPVYYFKDEGLYRMLLTSHQNLGLTVEFFTEFQELISKWSKNSKLALVEPVMSKGTTGTQQEVFPAHKVRVLLPDFEGAGPLVLDESPRSYSEGLFIPAGRELVEFDNSLWQVYLDRRKHLAKLVRREGEIRSNLISVVKEIHGQPPFIPVGREDREPVPGEGS